MNDSVGMRGEIVVNLFEGDLPHASSDLVALLDGGYADVWNSQWLGCDIWRNLVTNVGRQLMTKLIVAETTVGVGYIGLSTSIIVPALTDTVLPNELARAVVSVKQSVATYSQRYVIYAGPTAFASTGIGGLGLFDTASTGGNMFADASVTISKSASQSLTVDWRVTASTGV